MGLTVDSTPQRDAGTGKHSQPTKPITYEADDVTNKSTGDTKPQHNKSTTFTADATEVSSTGEHETSGPITTAADWPLPKGEDKAVHTGEAKSTTAKKKGS